MLRSPIKKKKKMLNNIIAVPNTTYKKIFR